MKVVLVVDDEPANIDLISGILRGPYKVKAATSGERALKIAAKDPGPDVVLLDVMMPEMDGYEVLAKLKEAPATASIPVLFITGSVSEEALAKAQAMGAPGMLGKPIEPAVLLERVKALSGED